MSTNKHLTSKIKYKLLPFILNLKMLPNETSNLLFHTKFLSRVSYQNYTSSIANENLIKLKMDQDYFSSISRDNKLIGKCCKIEFQKHDNDAHTLTSTLSNFLNIVYLNILSHGNLFLHIPFIYNIAYLLFNFISTLSFLFHVSYHISLIFHVCTIIFSELSIFEFFLVNMPKSET